MLTCKYHPVHNCKKRKLQIVANQKSWRRRPYLSVRARNGVSLKKIQEPKFNQFDKTWFLFFDFSRFSQTPDQVLLNERYWKVA